MDTHNRHFHPENVDADIDQFLQIRDQEEIAAQTNVRFIHEMSDIYLEESQVLDRAWQRLSEQISTPTNKETLSIQDYQKQKRGMSHMQDLTIPRNTSKQKTLVKRLSALTVGLVAALIVVSMILSITAYQRSHMPSTATAATRTTTTHQSQPSIRIVAGPASNIIPSLTATIRLHSNVGKPDVTIPHSTYPTVTIPHSTPFQTVLLTYTVHNADPNGHIFQKLYFNYHQGTTQQANMHQVQSNTSGSFEIDTPQNEPLKVELWWNNQLAQTAYINVR
jgi:hypothetical protein